MNKKFLAILASSVLLLASCVNKPVESNPANGESAETLSAETISGGTTASNKTVSSHEILTSEAEKAQVTISPDDAPSSNTGYPADGEIVKNEVTLAYHLIMKSATTGAAYIQMKKSGSYFKNTAAITCKKVVIDQYFENKGYDGTLTVTARADASAPSSTVTSTESLDGTTKTLTYTIPEVASYWSFTNDTGYAFKALKIVFYLY